jgi:superfamily I DNA/RNA helicase
VLKDQAPESASLLIVGDGTQYFFKKRPYSWSDAGVAARGRTHILKKNYRNTHEILGAAFPLVANQQRNDPDGPATVTELPECLRHGSEPEVVKLAGRADECDYAAALIQSWLLGGVTIRGRREKLHPADIAVIHPGVGGLDPESLASRLRGFTQVNLLKDYTDRLDRDGVRIVTMQRVTGLQFRAVIILWSDLLTDENPLRDDRALLYMAMTRAEDVLVILHSGRSELVDQISGALEAQAT